MSTTSERLNMTLNATAVLDIDTALNLLEVELDGFRTLTSEEKSHQVRIGTNNLSFLRTQMERR